jgi:D-arabinose 1-dehydrogenase-like Zn-dependent alcohol dehydrogenase
VVSGATSRQAPCDELSRVLFLQLSVVGSTMGIRDELNRLARFCVDAGVRPVIHSTLPLDQAVDGFRAMAHGDLVGKVVFSVAP